MAGTPPAVASGDHDDYEHLVRIDDPAQPRREWLAREALWDGLWRSLAVPAEHDASIDDCQLEAVGAEAARRRVRRGDHLVHDELEWRRGEWLRVRPDPHGPHAGSSLEMHIEEPAEGVLFVRFRYRLVTAEGEAASAPERAARHTAWREADLARIRALRAAPRG